DNGNMPRLETDSQKGLVTDVCLKRKIRNYVDLKKEGKPPFAIYMQEKAVLNNQHMLAYEALGIEPSPKKLPKEEEKAREITAWMCENFYDIRTFGAVMTTNVNAGQVRGPMQLTFARSIDPVVPLDVSITRVTITRPEDARVVSGDGDEQGGGKTTEMGRKALVPYGLYRAHGFFVPSFAERSGFDSEDLELFWMALQQMWDVDR